MDTPVSAWYRVCAGQLFSFLLESVEGGERVGRYSLLGCNPLWRLEARGDRTIQTWRDGSTKTHTGNPLEHLSECLKPIQPVKLVDLPTGGLIGFWGYELLKWIEPRVPVYACGDRDLPDGLWIHVDNLLVFDQVKRKIWAIAIIQSEVSIPLLLLRMIQICDFKSDRIGCLGLSIFILTYVV